MTWAHVEFFHGGVVRVFEDDGASCGTDPYQYAMMFKRIDPHTVELVGVTQPPTISQVRAIVAALQSAEMCIQRVRVGGARPGTKRYRRMTRTAR